jgi:hypothetical protein
LDSDDDDDEGDEDEIFFRKRVITDHDLFRKVLCPF